VITTWRAQHPAAVGVGAGHLKQSTTGRVSENIVARTILCIGWVVMLK